MKVKPKGALPRHASNAPFGEVEGGVCRVAKATPWQGGGQAVLPRPLAGSSPVATSNLMGGELVLRLDLGASPVGSIPTPSTKPAYHLVYLH